MSMVTQYPRREIMKSCVPNVFALSRLILLLTFLCASRAKGASFVETESMGNGRFVGTATLLANGQVLVAGGGGNPIFENVASAELYDPATHAWSFVDSLSIARISHSAVLLPNGKVLVAGGANNFFTNVTSAELYDPATRSWTNTGSMAVGRFNHQMLLLPTGKVLVVGGFDDALLPLLSAEIYDPAVGVWSPAGSIAGSAKASTLLADGRVLLLEGRGTNESSAAAEIYDPATGRWTSTGAPATNHLSAVLLQNGKVLAMGGVGGQDSNFAPFTTTELYDPLTGQWSPTGPLNIARSGHRATLLRAGKVLVTGGSRAGISPIVGEDRRRPESFDDEVDAQRKLKDRDRQCEERRQ